MTTSRDPPVERAAPQRRRPTMREVAGLAGVSISTVSRVVNSDRRVDRTLAGRVHEAARMLGYRHNAAASALRRSDGITASIGLILEDVANPFFSAVHRGIEDVARGSCAMPGAVDGRPAAPPPSCSPQPIRPPPCSPRRTSSPWRSCARCTRSASTTRSPTSASTT